MNNITLFRPNKSYISTFNMTVKDVVKTYDGFKELERLWINNTQLGQVCRSDYGINS